MVKKIKLSLTRDESQAINEFFKLWILLCDSRKRNEPGEPGKMAWDVFKCIIDQVKTKFDKRLQSPAKNHRFTFTAAESIIVIRFLLNHPIPDDQEYLINLRQRIINELYKQS